MGLSLTMPTRAVIHGYSKLGDAETLDIAVLDRPTKVKHGSFATDGALGAGNGIDVLDGGGDGTGTDVIFASSDNLNGEEEDESPDGSYNEMADDDVLRITFDDYASATDCFVEVLAHTWRQ